MGSASKQANTPLYTRCLYSCLYISLHSILVSWLEPNTEHFKHSKKSKISSWALSKKHSFPRTEGLQNKRQARDRSRAPVRQPPFSTTVQVREPRPFDTKCLWLDVIIRKHGEPCRSPQAQNFTPTVSKFIPKRNEVVQNEVPKTCIFLYSYKTHKHMITLPT